MIRITHDVFDIADRVKEVDERYVIFFNPKKGRFELHCEEYGRTGFLLVLPFLDARAVEHCRKTRRERQLELIEEIERQNLILEKQAMYETKKRAEDNAEALLSGKEIL